MNENNVLGHPDVAILHNSKIIPVQKQNVNAQIFFLKKELLIKKTLCITYLV